MDLSTILSDDQLAVLGCFSALAVCGLIAAVSFHLGPAGRQRRSVGTNRFQATPESANRRIAQPSDRRAA